MTPLITTGEIGGSKMMKNKRVFFIVLVPLFVLVLVSLWWRLPASAEEKAEKTLYERLGGIYAIASVVDDFIDLLYVNDVLNANPAIKEARESPAARA